jgi:recombinational DNA repair ATPase RecF
MSKKKIEEKVTDKNKIQSITLKNVKAFREEQTIEFEGKNVLIYGENGSGKSSLAQALEVIILGNYLEPI